MKLKLSLRKVKQMGMTRIGKMLLGKTPASVRNIRVLERTLALGGDWQAYRNAWRERWRPGEECTMLRLTVFGPHPYGRRHMLSTGYYYFEAIGPNAARFCPEVDGCYGAESVIFGFIP